MTLPSPTDRNGEAPAVAGALLEWYGRYGRHDLPWRTDRTPYRVVVSEFMLQQTQVDRVVPPFLAFTSRWPAFEALATAPLAEVVRAWKGLGYNSRAARLHALAKRVVERYGGLLPEDPLELSQLPGVGPYTLSAVRAFAFDRPVVAIDTNLRRIFHRVRYGLEWPPLASPAEIEAYGLGLAAEAGTGFELNSALMDLGATICTARTPKCLLCPLQRTCAAAPVDTRTLAARAAEFAPKRGVQATIAFEASTRYLRGRIVDRLRDVARDGWLPVTEIECTAASLRPPREPAEVATVISALIVAGLVERAEDSGQVRLRQ